jgi:glycosyltransferase involved in cell wall biosynthesis
VGTIASQQQPKVRILYDGLLFSTPQTGGARRYFSNLISRLPSTDEPWITTTQMPELHFPTHPNLQVRESVRVRPQKLSSLLERVYFRRLEQRYTFDLAHPTYYNLLSRQRLSDYRCPAIITVHDMISELFSDGSAAAQRESTNKRHAVADAARVICISHNTKKDLVEMLGVSEEKTRVIYLASEVSLAMASGEEPVPERPYFLYVGGHEAPYKNFPRLMRSFAQVATRHADVALCVVGPPLTNVECQSAEALRIASRVVHFGRPTDAHLAKLYLHSVALVYASLYEGFGIPPLEAMACETAVIAANRSSIPEVVGDAAILVDPESIEQISAAMMTVLEDRSRREELIGLGRDRAKHFSWDKMAAETREVYREVVGQ